MGFLYLSFVDWAVIISSILGAVYFYITWNYDFFEKRNISYAKPTFPFGNFGPVILKKASFCSMIKDSYDKFPNDKFFGVFEFRRPNIFIRDPEIIKQVAVKDYDYFLDHRFVADPDIDPFFGRVLFVLKGQKWKDMRVTLSPAFTGSKMRAMYTLTNDCAKQVVDYLNQKTNSGSCILELKDLYRRFAMDVVASAAFGIKTDSVTDENNEFYKMGKHIATPTTIQTLKMFGYTAFPAVMKFLKLNFLDNFTTSFFRNIITNTIAVRERDNIHRPDMIHLLMQARKGTLKSDSQVEVNEGFAAVKEHLSADVKNMSRRELTEDDIIAQALVFFFAGFDTASSLMSFAAYEITINEHVQTKLQAEIDLASSQNEIITYEVIQNLKYLDMVISESLRKWPPSPATDRLCIKPYTLYDGEKHIKVNPGDAIFIPIYALHQDPKYFPEPEKFDPERFNDENKHKIKTGTYLPFGIGPRNCIGSRFAIMEAKAIMFHVLLNFELKICEKTQIPLRLSNELNPIAEKGFWITFKPRRS